jgi:S1-C subfamily serine protease
MKTQKGFIQTPLLITIVVGVLVLGGAGYFGVKQYQKSQQENIAKEQQTQDQQKALEQAQVEIEKLKQDSENAKTKQQQLEQTIKAAPKPATTNSLASIIKSWRPRIAFVNCSYKYGVEATGSGLLIGDYIDTNTHVFKYNGVLIPLNCKISLPDRSTVYNADVSGSIIYGGGVDIAGIRISNTDSYTESLGAQKINYCQRKAEIGESVVILGYPYTGSTNDITATEGIVSGYDDWSYITSAKIEHGNSGGATILTKDNCYLGIPSSVVAGELESLGRILDGRIMSDGFYFERHGNGIDLPNTCNTQQECMNFCKNNPVLCKDLQDKGLI